MDTDKINFGTGVTFQEKNGVLGKWGCKGPFRQWKHVENAILRKVTGFVARSR